MVYGAMSNWEYLKGLAGEGEDLRYRNALPQAHKDGAKARVEAKAVQAKAGADRKAALEAKLAKKAKKDADRQTAKQAKAEAKAQKAAARQAAKEAKVKAKLEKKKLGMRSEELGANGKKPEIATAQPTPIGAGPRNDGNKGFLGKIGDVIQQKTGLTSQEIKEQVEKNLLQDAKQAANYQIRKGLRNIFKDMF